MSERIRELYGEILKPGAYPYCDRWETQLESIIDELVEHTNSFDTDMYALKEAAFHLRDLLNDDELERKEERMYDDE